MAYRVTQPDAEEALVSTMQWYTVRNHAEVQYFLRQHPFLLGVLAEAHERIPRYFPAPQLSLWIMSDPERGAGDACELVLSIETALEVADAMERRERLADEWWLDALPATGGKLSIDLEFV